MFRRWSLLTFAIILAPFTLAAWSAQPKGTNYAFLVGCSKYQKTEFRPLPYTSNDVLGFKAALKTTGFDDDNMVVLFGETKEPERYLPNKANILQELDLLLAGMKKNDTLVVALSGHGVQFKGDPVSYFVPVDGKVADKTSLIPLDGKGSLYERISKCNAAKKLLIVNACRNDPAANINFATTKVELVDEDRKQEVPEGIAAIYSCQAGQMSFFDEDRKLAIFFDHVIRAWKGEYTTDGKVTLEKFFQQVEGKTTTDARKNFGRPQVPLVMREYKGSWEIGAAARPTDTASNKATKPAKENKELNPKSKAAAKTIELDLGGGVSMKLTRIDPGKFMMGSPAGEEGRFDNEFQHEVKITNPFHMGSYTVTRGQFRAFVDAVGYKTDAEKDGKGGGGYDPEIKKLEGRKPKYSWKFTGFDQNDEHPVVNVSWNDAKEFCKWLSTKTRDDVALPTEAQWEYACRAGKTTRYFTGNAEASLEGYANVRDLTAKGTFSDWTSTFPFRDGHAFTAPVGSFARNPWDLYDMHGNVWQWCEDLYGANFYKEPQAKTDPTGPASGKTRLMRGGAFDTYPRLCRAAYRVSAAPGQSNYGEGFRVVLRFASRTP